MKELKVIVAGGRDFTDYDKLSAVIFDYAESVGEDVAVSIVSGMARGADKLAHTFARNEGVQVHEFPADWDTYGKRAGFVRNDQMSVFADALIAFHDGSSRGTANMIQTMRRLGKPVLIINY
jgi:hypothetical protein